jgi:hypothetical protein
VQYSLFNLYRLTTETAQWTRMSHFRAFRAVDMRPLIKEGPKSETVQPTFLRLYFFPYKPFLSKTNVTKNLFADKSIDAKTFASLGEGVSVCTWSFYDNAHLSTAVLAEEEFRSANSILLFVLLERVKISGYCCCWHLQR